MERYSIFTNGNTVRAVVSIANHKVLVKISTRSPTLNTGPCPARI